ncbi:MAG: lipid A-modifier LpxR family protein [Gammaproteobacteria bacterium]
MFTPENITTTSPIFDQHPYASLLFVSNTQVVVIPEDFVSYQSTLTVGFMGLSLSGELQKSLLQCLFRGAVQGQRGDL